MSHNDAFYFKLFIFRKCSLLLAKFDEFLVYIEAFPLSYWVHVCLSPVLEIRFVAKLLELFFSSRDPEWILINSLPVTKAQLWHRQSRSFHTQIVSEIERFNYRNDSLQHPHATAFNHVWNDHLSIALRYFCIAFSYEASKKRKNRI